MHAELREVLEDPVFARSPALARMLYYLVDVSAGGNGASLKSYTVAVEGLGRSPDFDSQVNTYARVLAARLRHALDVYYHGPGAHRPKRLAIALGSYEVELVGNQRSDAVPDTTKPASRNARSFAKSIWLALSILALVASGLLATWLVREDRADTARWRTPNSPLVLVRMAPTSNPQDEIGHGEIEEIFATSISNYETVRVAGKFDSRVAYVVELTPQYQKSGLVVEVALIDVLRNRKSHSGEIAIAQPSEVGAAEARQIERLAFGLFGYSGAIAAAERTSSFTTETPYDCWLRFSGGVLVDGGIADSKLTSCAKEWFEHAPRHPIAVAVYAWTLTNAMIGVPPGARREEKLDEAVAILETARATNPNSRHVMLSLARAYAYKGESKSLRKVAADLNRAGGANPDIRGAVGTLMVLQNDPGGEAELDAAIASYPDTAPSRFYAGKFVAAMMRDDVRAAGIVAGKIAAGNQSSFWSRLLRAAYYSRAGKLDQARLHWSLATAKRPLLANSPEALVADLPAADPVKQRLLEWLKPMLDPDDMTFYPAS